LNLNTFCLPAQFWKLNKQAEYSSVCLLVLEASYRTADKEQQDFVVFNKPNCHLAYQVKILLLAQYVKYISITLMCLVM